MSRLAQGIVVDGVLRVCDDEERCPRNWRPERKGIGIYYSDESGR